jgi:beta-RFAP synthase
LLHFGASKLWPNVDGVAAIPSRQFGGVGMMIDQPGITVRARRAGSWSASGPMKERALDFARRFAESVPGVPAAALEIETSCAKHVGLGSGTQLGLAVAKALAILSGHENWVAIQLARCVDRGRRSAIGIHGFQHGGFLVEGGKRAEGEISPLLIHVAVPKEWRIVMALPDQPEGQHDKLEMNSFAELAEHLSDKQTDTLCRLALLGMAPAVLEGDLHPFGEALYDFNALVGEMFSIVQGGRYSSSCAAEVVAFCRAQGVSGVGQSSWGPTIFAVVENSEYADFLRQKLAGHFGGALRSVWVSTPNSTGAVLSKEG